VAPKAVEVIRRGNDDVGPEVQNLRLLLDDNGQFVCDARGLFKRRFFRHVDAASETALAACRSVSTSCAAKEAVKANVLWLFARTLPHGETGFVYWSLFAAFST